MRRVELTDSEVCSAAHALNILANEYERDAKRPGLANVAASLEQSAKAYRALADKIENAEDTE